MAEKLQPKTKAVTAAGIKKAVAAIQADKDKASEFNGAAGKTQQQFMKEHGLDRTAFNFVMKLNKMEVIHQQGTLRGVIEYAHKMGMFDEVDAFDDMIALMRKIADEVEKRRHNAKPVDPIIDDLTGGNDA